MPLPSQIAPGKSSFRDFIIDFVPSERDYDYFNAWLETEKPSEIDCVRMVINANWKLSVTPSSDAAIPWLALTCKRPGAYLQGFTVSPRGIGVEYCFAFSAWLVVSIAALLADDIDGFLTYGSGWVSNEAGNGKNSSSDDEIPF